MPADRDNAIVVPSWRQGADTVVDRLVNAFQECIRDDNPPDMRKYTAMIRDRIMMMDE